MSATAHAWMEYAVSYARIIYSDEHHSFKGGITAKLLQGLGAGYLTFNDYRYQFHNDEWMGVYDSYGQFGMSQNLEDGEFVFDFVGGPGFGVDIGFTYEYREPEINRKGLYGTRRKDQVKNFGILAGDETKYKLKAGISFNDIGGMSYNKSQNSRDFYANNDSLNLHAFDPVNSPGTFAQTLQTVFFSSASNQSSYFMDLPTHIHLFFDYRFRKGFALHTSLMLPFNHGTIDPTKNHYLYQLAITPRWESKWFGVYMPLSFNEYLLYNLGISFRLGPLVVGTGDILGTLMKREYASLDLHMGLRLIIPKKAPKSNRSKCPAYL